MSIRSYAPALMALLLATGAVVVGMPIGGAVAQPSDDDGIPSADEITHLIGSASNASSSSSNGNDDGGDNTDSLSADNTTGGSSADDNTDSLSADNTTGGSSADDNEEGNIMINEIELNPQSNNDDKEWIELYNPSDSDVNIGDYKIRTSK